MTPWSHILWIRMLCFLKQQAVKWKWGATIFSWLNKRKCEGFLQGGRGCPFREGTSFLGWGRLGDFGLFFQKKSWPSLVLNLKTSWSPTPFGDWQKLHACMTLPSLLQVVFHAVEISGHFTFEPKCLNIWIYLDIFIYASNQYGIFTFYSWSLNMEVPIIINHQIKSKKVNRKMKSNIAKILIKKVLEKMGDSPLK